MGTAGRSEDGNGGRERGRERRRAGSTGHPAEGCARPQVQEPGHTLPAHWTAPENSGPISGGRALPPSLCGVLSGAPSPARQGEGRRLGVSPPAQSPYLDISV